MARIPAPAGCSSDRLPRRTDAARGSRWIIHVFSGDKVYAGDEPGGALASLGRRFGSHQHVSGTRQIITKIETRLTNFLVEFGIDDVGLTLDAGKTFDGAQDPLASRKIVPGQVLDRLSFEIRRTTAQDRGKQSRIIVAGRYLADWLKIQSAARTSAHLE